MSNLSTDTGFFDVFCSGFAGLHNYYCSISSRENQLD